MEDYTNIIAEELANAGKNQAFGLHQQSDRDSIETRSQLFHTVAPDILQLCQDMGLTDTESILRTLWNLWLPLSLELVAERQKLNRPVVQGILGGQGTGKTTLAEVLRLILEELDYTSVTFSLDDLYKSYIERQQLQRYDPRLIWRGPPGTHDVEIGVDLLDKLRQTKRRKPVIVPRFDKSACQGAGDKAQPEVINPVDIIIFEGWFVGVRPVPDNRIFDNAPDPINTPEDIQFAKDINDRLFDYVALWHRLDRLMVLFPEDYRLSKQWRIEAEQKMKATGRGGMKDEEIEQFVEYFWKALHPELFITPLIRNPILTDLVVAIKRDRTIDKIYRPEHNQKT
ncbi:glycerate kinase [Spirulina sp. 06S082]|uniref:glycerate kinase n=1 Tax=Spirulina sp. 06S082 TaxID=3110248 RepID=UPI002B1EB458|nr:glycerate kinase [Spirulina sp. 06S082]MEA5467658.1 glycerate kinase [Spirulina sp. 06S082]